MVINVKTRLVLAGAVLGVSLLALARANAQINPNTGVPTTPGMEQTTPGTTTTTPQPLPDYSSMDAGTGGAGLQPVTPLPSVFGEDAGFGGLTPLPSLGDLDAGLR